MTATTRRLALAGLLVAIAVAWLPALHAPFTYDDRIEVVGNRTLRWLDDLGTIAAYNTSRPLLILTYALDWRLGGLDPFGYHVVSVVLHGINALLAWRLARRLLAPSAALLTTALWALHPMTTESVTYITGRSDALEATAWLVALTAWIDLRRAQAARSGAEGEAGGGAGGVGVGGVGVGGVDGREGVPPPGGRVDVDSQGGPSVAGPPGVPSRQGAPRGSPARHRAVAIGAVAAALLTKEGGVLLPVALLAVDRWLAPAPAAGTPRAARRIDHLPFWIVGAAAVAVRLGVYGWPAPEVPRGALAQLLSQAEVWVRYAALWALPAGQSILHDHPGVARLLGGIALAAWAAVALVLFGGARRAAPGSPAALRAFALALWAAWLLPSSLVPLLETMAEHRAHFAGFALLLGVVGSLSAAARADAPVAESAAVVPSAAPTAAARWSARAAWALVPVLLAATLARNRVWADEAALWGDAAAKNPASARAWYGKAEALRYAGRHAEAVPAYERAVALAPDDPDPLIGLGITRAETGDRAGARAAFDAILARDPRSCPAHNNLGKLATLAGDLVAARASYTATLAWCPDDAIAHINLANLALDRAGVREAAFHFREYLRVAEDGPYAAVARERLARMGVR